MEHAWRKSKLDVCYLAWRDSVLNSQSIQNQSVSCAPFNAIFFSDFLNRIDEITKMISSSLAFFFFFLANLIVKQTSLYCFSVIDSAPNTFERISLVILYKLGTRIYGQHWDLQC